MRALVALSAIVPSGVLMGFGFPTGMQIVNGIDPRPTPWFWAINGSAGVLATGLAVTISMEFSISTTLYCGAVSYILLGPVTILLSRLGTTHQPIGKEIHELPELAKIIWLTVFAHAGREARTVLAICLGSTAKILTTVAR